MRLNTSRRSGNLDTNVSSAPTALRPTESRALNSEASVLLISVIWDLIAVKHCLVPQFVGEHDVRELVHPFLRVPQRQLHRPATKWSLWATLHEVAARRPLCYPMVR